MGWYMFTLTITGSVLHLGRLLSVFNKMYAPMLTDEDLAMDITVKKDNLDQGSITVEFNSEISHPYKTVKIMSMEHRDLKFEIVNEILKEKIFVFERGEKRIVKKNMKK